MTIAERESSTCVNILSKRPELEDSVDMIYLDGTNVLKTALSIPTGIPRIEREICKFFLTHRGDAEIVCRDTIHNDFSVLSDIQKASLLSLVEIDDISVKTNLPYWARLSFTMRTLLSAPLPADKELHRSLSNVLTSPAFLSKGMYQAHKTLFRLAGRFTAARRSSDKTRATRRLSGEIKPTDRFLISSTTMMQLSRYVPSGASVLLYDTVPLDRPDFTTQGIASRFPAAFERMMGAAAEVICISDHTAARSLYWCGQMGIVTPPRHRVFPIASPLVERQLAPQPIERLAGQPFALYCSTLEPRKNHLTLLRAWSDLTARAGTKAPLLVLCGRLGWKYAAFFAEVEANPRLAAKVVLISECTDGELVWLYRNARFTVFPSFEEGWGLGAAESLDFGTPVIVSSTPALVEATQGLMPVLDPLDQEAWSARIAEWSSNDNILAEMRKTIAKRYRRVSVEESMLRLAAILSEGLPLHPRRRAERSDSP